MRRSNISINRDAHCEGLLMINPFRKDKEITAKEKKKQEERRQKAQARGQKPIR
jgi:hypothetical protein